MIILGVDPGSRITGYALVRKDGARVSHIENGIIDCQKEKTFADRLVLLFTRIQGFIRQFQPQAIAIENIFYSKNVQSTLKLGHARGAIIVCAALERLEIFEYTPLEIKQAVVGYGAASKEQVQKMVKTLLQLPEVAEENASDALAAAICHAHSADLKKLLKL